MAGFSHLIPAVTTAFGIQTLLAMIFVPLQNEKYYDLGGCAGFVSTALVSLYYPTLRSNFLEGKLGPLPSIMSFAPRQLLLTAALALWSVRLGSFLITRSIKAGGDKRFDTVRNDPAKFSFFWFIQAIWVLLCGLPIYAVNSLPPPNVHPALGLPDYAALALFAVSFLMEAVADAQKAAWRRAKDAKQHSERFITGGLWAVSRHPNYVGEVGVWTSIWALASGSLLTSYSPIGLLVLTSLSPLFAWFLVRKLSGVPFLEQHGDKLFSGDKKWEEYKRNVPVFWPWGSTGSREAKRDGAFSLF
ncbi:hypothetical protein FB451DRAFT_1282985 [Mycena latifolia]|nr:hypothetical protein FB451DRAFT_1282985 [Mycena latifolia]